MSWKLNLPSPRYSHNYNKIAPFLDMSTLESHRKFNDYVCLFNLLSLNIDCPTLYSKLSWQIFVRGTRLNQRSMLHIPFAKTNTSFFAPLWRMCRMAKEFNLNLNLSIKVFKIKQETHY